MQKRKIFSPSHNLNLKLLVGSHTPQKTSMEPENGPTGRGDSYWKSSFSVNLSIGESTIAFKACPKMRLLVVVGSFLFVVDLVPSQVQYTIGTPPKTNMQAEIGLLEKEISFGNYHFPCYFQENM